MYYILWSLRLRLTQKYCNYHSIFFFFFSFLVTFSGRTAKSYLVNVLSQAIKKAYDQDLPHSLDTLKSLSIKVIPKVVICDACGTWHGLYTVTSIHSIQQRTRNSQKVGNKLASGWQKIKGSKQKEIELISKKVWRKRREKMFRLRSCWSC